MLSFFSKVPQEAVPERGQEQERLLDLRRGEVPDRAAKRQDGQGRAQKTVRPGEPGIPQLVIKIMHCSNFEFLAQRKAIQRGEGKKEKEALDQDEFVSFYYRHLKYENTSVSFIV